jgi:5-methylcytosine-specific restriction enzyme A
LLSTNASKMLKFLVGKLNVIESGEPETYLSYKEVHDELNLKLNDSTYGRSLRNQGLGELAEWLHKKKLPGITGIIINQDSYCPGKGYYEAFSRENDDFQWWKNEIVKSTQLNWEPILQNFNLVPETNTASSNSWIFQGNPKRFKIDEYLKNNRYVWWSVNQEHFLEDISLGDTVYIWRADGGKRGTGGIVAKGKVTGAPETNVVSSEYWMNVTETESHYSVPIEIEDHLVDREIIRRAELLDNPELEDLLILRMANNTNYLLNIYHAEKLEELWSSKDIGFSYARLQHELFSFTYINKKETKYYILTVKRWLEDEKVNPFRYDVLLIKNKQVIKEESVEGPSPKGLLTLAKEKSLALLITYDPLVNISDVKMIHYKQDRKGNSPWDEEPHNDLLSQFNKQSALRLNQTISDDIESEDAQFDHFYKDGKTREFYGNRYERNSKNRLRAIEIHGTSCHVCGFNFEEVYGLHGKDYIEIHHIKPLSSIKQAVEINPETDLIPLCSNCHRMVHRKKDHILSIQEMRDLLRLPQHT